MFFKMHFLKNLAKFTWKHLSQSLFFNKVSGLLSQDCNFIKKETLAQVFSCKFLEYVCWLLLKLKYKSGFPGGFQYACNILTKIFNWSSLHLVYSVTIKLIVDWYSMHHQFSSKLQIWSQLQKKPLMENFIFCVMLFLNTPDNSNYCLDKTWRDNSNRRIKGGDRIRREWFEFST